MAHAQLEVQFAEITPIHPSRCSNMVATVRTAGTGEAAVMAVLAAVLEGRIDIDTLNSAVRRVLQWKINLGLL